MPNFKEKTYALFSSPANKKIVSALGNIGAKVFQFPPLETEMAVLSEASIADIKNLAAFDWIIFPDVLTVDYFLQILPENEIDLFEMDSLRVCAFGEPVSDRLRFVRLHADVVPTSLATANVFSALSDYIGKADLINQKFLLPTKKSRNYEIKESLIHSGATVTEMSVYRAKISASDELAKLKVLLKGGAIDEFIFSSPADLIALESYFNDDSISVTMSEINSSATDKSIIQNLLEHDIKASYFHLK